ncbi:MAG: SUMF1/EgtB/PvdO family nonheme iron enzyme [Acidobacteria bacterium]|nr:SUMF1/EgtB/PvdO family nonheme iron enzyme [Acidobacteriota bacterium]
MASRRGRLSLLAACCVIAESASGQFPLRRGLVEGETAQYELRLQVLGQRGTLYGVSEHRVVREGGVPVERVRWVRMDETEVGDLSPLLQDAPAFDLSLDPSLPPPPLPAVRGPVARILTETLYRISLAVSPSLGAMRLAKPGDVVETVQPFIADGFAEPGPYMERWAATLTFELVSSDADKAVVRTRFSAPAAAPWPPLQPWMTATCNDGVTAFESVALEDSGYAAAWGCDDTFVQVTLSSEDGSILNARLETIARYFRRWCAGVDLTGCEEIEEGSERRSATLVRKNIDPPLPPDCLSTNQTDGLEYVLIPAGEFQMGCVPDDEECYEREKPRHTVAITQPFRMGRTETPVRAFERFAAATGRAMPPEPDGLPDYNDGWEKKDHPMVKVTWQEAQEYCAWAGGRLPTEAEWEYAARGGSDGLKYPWGNERSHEEANYWRSGGRDRWKHTAPVASFPANGFGLYDMAGNVYEWTADWYDEQYYGRSPAQDPPGPSQGKARVARGGAGFINPAVLRISTRLSHAPNQRNLHVGFRCVLEGPGD